MNKYTVICAHGEKVGISVEARLYIEQVQARTPELAVAVVGGRCPATPTDVVVFKGEHYGHGDDS